MEKEQEERNEMTKEQAVVDTWDLDYQIGVMQAFKEGAQIESKLRDRRSLVWQKESNPSWDWFSYEFRIKPTPTLRPWTADEVPLGSVVRYKTDPQRRFLLVNVETELRRLELLENCEVSAGCGFKWLPCGVVEEVK